MKKRIKGGKRGAVHSQPEESLGQLIQFIQTVKPEDIGGKESLLQKFVDQQGRENVSDDLKKALAQEQQEEARTKDEKARSKAVER